MSSARPLSTGVRRASAAEFLAVEIAPIAGTTALVGTQCREATIDSEVAAVDPGRLVGTDESHDVRDLLHASDAAERVKIGAGAVGKVLDSGAHADDVRQDETQARQLGISGVPFFVFDMALGASGAQPTELFSRALDQAWERNND